MDHPSLDIALRSVANASRVARSVQQNLDHVREITKDDRSPVTVADFAVQAIVTLDLLEHDQDVLIVGEERADALRHPDQARVLEAVIEAVHAVRPGVATDVILDAIDRGGHDGSGDAYWLLDPVDGTKGFLRGQQYAIALGRIEGGVVGLGIMGCPNLPRGHDRPLDVADAAGAMYAAVAGQGAEEIDPERPTASGVTIAAAACPPGTPIRACESVEAAHSKQDDTARILDALGGAGEPARLDSQCKYAVVARGQADAYLRLPTRADYVEKIWDHAAGSLIATESGAIVTDVTGAPLDFTHGRRLETNKGVVCAASDLHGRVIDAIASVLLARSRG